MLPYLNQLLLQIENLNSVGTVLKNYTRIKVSDNVGANRICKVAPYVSHCFRLRI